MPRCQRTFRALGGGAVAPGSGVRSWICTHCPDAEVYETVRDADLLHYADLARSWCAAQFGAPPDAARPAILLLGLRPECVFEPGERRYDLYLQRGSDPWQLRLQIGHEMFHRVCSRGRIFHWTHEMLACLVSVRLLRRLGMDEYAERRESEWREEARLLPLPDMLAADLWTLGVYPPGYYGRAFVTGEAVVAAAGWEATRRLARSVLPGGLTPDVEGWIARLPPEAAARVRAALAG
jgi:hypothetical protein